MEKGWLNRRAGEKLDSLAAVVAIIAGQKWLKLRVVGVENSMARTAGENFCAESPEWYPHEAEASSNRCPWMLMWQQLKMLPSFDGSDSGLAAPAWAAATVAHNAYVAATRLMLHAFDGSNLEAWITWADQYCRLSTPQRQANQTYPRLPGRGKHCISFSGGKADS